MSGTFDGFDPFAFATNDVDWFRVPYEYDTLPWGKTQRRLELNVAANEILAAGGDFVEAETQGDRAFVKVRAPKGLLTNLEATWERIPDPAAAWTPTYTTPSGKTVACKPWTQVEQECPDQAGMMALTERIDELVAVADQDGFALVTEPWPLASKLLVMAGERGYGLDRIRPGTFPTTSILKTFTHANDELTAVDSDWSVLGGADSSNVMSNQIAAAIGPYVGNWIDTTTYGADAEVFMTVATSGPYFGVFARMSDSAATYDAYQASWGSDASNNLTLQDNDEAVQTQIGSAVTLTKSSGDSLGLECIGSTIVCYTETGGTWTTRITTTNSRITVAGNIGFDMFDNTGIMRLDDFGGGTVVAAAAGIPSLVMAPPVAA